MREYAVQLPLADDFARDDALLAALTHPSDLPVGVDDFTQAHQRVGCFIDVQAGFDATVLSSAGMHAYRL